MGLSEIFDALVTPEVRMFLTGVVVIVFVFYIISVIWVIRDAYLRGANPIIWGLIGLVPFLGAFTYSMLRPPMLLSDRDEQDLDFTLKQRQLMQYGECANCGHPVERDYLVCPQCATELRIKCPTCGHALNPEWQACPYCGTSVRSEQLLAH